MALALQGKTPAQVVSEFCAKNRAQLRHEYPPIPIGSVQFQCVTTVENVNGRNYTSVGIGSNKKSAMQNACTKMLAEQLQISFYEKPNQEALLLVQSIESNATQEEGTSASSAPFNPEDDVEMQNMAMEGNPIGELAAFSEEHNSPCAVYSKDEERTGPAHCPLFTVWCTVGKIKDKGTTRKLQMSKRVAAYKVLTKLIFMVSENQDLEKVKENVITEEEKGNIFLAVKTFREARLGENINRIIQDVNPSGSECEERFQQLHSAYLTIKLVPPLEELFAATENFLGIMEHNMVTASQMDATIQKWFKERAPELGGIVEFFEYFLSELKLSYTRVVKVRNASKTPFSVNRRDQRPTASLNFRQMGEANNTVTMVIIQLEKGEGCTLKVPTLPTGVGFGGTQVDAFEGAISEILLYFAALSRSTCIYKRTTCVSCDQTMYTCKCQPDPGSSQTGQTA